MKIKSTSLILIITLVFSFLFTATPVKAAAYGTTFTTSVTYQNVDTNPATITINFYPQNSGTPIIINRPDLAAGASTSVYVGGITELGTSFNGSAILTSGAKLAATIVQIAPTASGVKNRPLSNGFASGANYVLIPTVLKNTFNTNSVFSVMNVGSSATPIEVKFVPVSGSPIIYNIASLPSGAAQYFDMGTFPQITTSTFNGSVQLTAGTGGTIVATSMELSTSGIEAYAFEGAITDATKVYMPSAQCKFGPLSNTTTAYAVQNTSTTTAANVTIRYSNGNVHGPVSIPAGAKQSFDGCASAAGNPAGFSGSAVIEATGGANIVAVGKVYGGGVSSAFLGFNDGVAKLALPYVRWTEAHWNDATRQRAYIAIQNVGTTDIAAGLVTVKYVDKNGVVIGTQTLGAIAAGAKANSNPSVLGAAGAEFGAYSDGSFGGGAIVEGPVGSKLAVVVRITTSLGGGSMAAEDYSGIPIQ